ncbi:MAG: hypothetical protein OHK0029_00740 [Armatimonadaceae bacterium]
MTLERINPGPVNGTAPTVPLLLPPDDSATDRKTEYTIPNLELGTYRFVVTAYPNADGTGNPLATATVDQVVEAGDNNPLTVVMNATVESVEITPLETRGVGIGKRISYTATFRDAGNRIIMVDPRAIVWESLNTDIATVEAVDANGIATVAAVVAGTATIRATYQEPGTAAGAEGTGDSATATVEVVEGLEGSAWPKFHGNLQNTGQALSGSPTTGTELWQFFAQDSIVFSSPAVAEDGTVFVGSYDTNLYAINPDGTLRWQFPTGDIIESSPALSSDGTVYFGSMDGNVYAVDGDTGALKWQFTAEGPVLAPPTISTNGLLIVGCIAPGNKLYALDLTNGSVVWEYTAGGEIQTCAAFSNDYRTVYFGALDGNVYALDVTDGSERWVFATGEQILTSSPTVALNGVIYIGTLDGTLYAIQADGTALPGFTPVQTGASIFTSPAVARDGTVYFGTLDSATGLDDNSLIAVNGATGAIRWKFTINEPISSSPAIGADGVIYFGALNGNVYALNPNGTQKWVYDTDPNNLDPSRDDIESSPAIGLDGTIYIGGLSSRVFAIR